MNVALHAEEAAPIAPAALAAVPPDEVGRLVFRIDPAASWLGLALAGRPRSGGRTSPSADPETTVDLASRRGAPRDPAPGRRRDDAAPGVRRAGVPIELASGQTLEAVAAAATAQDAAFDLAAGAPIPAGREADHELRARAASRSRRREHGAGRLPRMTTAAYGGAVAGSRSGLAGWLGRLARVPLSLHQLLFRLGVASVFLPAGLIKASGWETDRRAVPGRVPRAPCFRPRWPPRWRPAPSSSARRS